MVLSILAILTGCRSKSVPQAFELPTTLQNHDRWQAAIDSAPADQKESVYFLVIHMPPRDLRDLEAPLVLEHVRLTHQVFDHVPWKAQVPLEVFQNAVLPYASVNESRDGWRRYFIEQFTPLLKDCTTPGEAAVILNNCIFEQLNVGYHPTLRPRPDQSPGESIAAGYASCTGLSILLVDACRTLGVPARLVGTPEWFTHQGDTQGNHGGNHTWVEIWDGQQWRVLGASEKSELDHVWFAPNAAQQWPARPKGRQYGIYAATWHKTGQSFPLVWDESIDWVNAEEVTADYAGRIAQTFDWSACPGAARLEVREGDRLIASAAGSHTTLYLSPAPTYRLTVRDPAGRSLSSQPWSLHGPATQPFRLSPIKN